MENPPHAIEVRRAQSNSLMGVTGQVDKADIISIAVVRYEDQLEQAKAATLRQIEHVRTTIADNEKALDKAAEAAVRAFDLTTERELVAGLKAAGFGAFEPGVKLESIDEPKRQIHVTVGIGPRGQVAYYNNAMSREQHLPFAGESSSFLRTCGPPVRRCRSSTANWATSTSGCRASPTWSARPAPSWPRPP